MLKIYDELFGSFVADADRFRTGLGDQASTFAAILRQRPVGGGPSLPTFEFMEAWNRWVVSAEPEVVGRYYEDYLRTVFRWALDSSIRDEALQHMKPAGLVRDRLGSVTLYLRPRPSTVALDAGEIRAITAAIGKAGILADSMSPAARSALRLPRARTQWDIDGSDAGQVIGGDMSSTNVLSDAAWGSILDSLEPGAGEATSAAPPEEPLSGIAQLSRQIVVTGVDAGGESATRFVPATPYSLIFKVGGPVAENLASGNTDVSDVPPEGVDARWVVSSSTVEFRAISSGQVEKVAETWAAEFDLAIPGAGDSAEVRLDITTTNAPGKIHGRIIVNGDEFRVFQVALDLGARIERDKISVATAHLCLRTTHEWTTPPVHIEIHVAGDLAIISTRRGSGDYPKARWTANSAKLKNPILLVREALDRFRVKFETDLDALDHADLASRLEGTGWFDGIYPGVGWSALQDASDATHRTAWDAASTSQQLWDLANQGYRLFNACFPEQDGGKLRTLIKSLPMGSRIDFNWSEPGNNDWVPHVPWALMYFEPPANGQPIDPMQFLGMRFRIGSRSWETDASSRALGDPNSVHALNFLYWGSGPNDVVATEASWQRETFKAWRNQRFLPAEGAPDRRREMLDAFETPQPDPAGILYLYCHCSGKDGVNPVLQFGESPGVADTIRVADLHQGRLTSSPLIFANACGTAVSDPFATNELEAAFFARDARAFVGTEARVPVKLASIFAWLFFQFFLRHADPDHEPMPAGEALAQARLFLWTQYRNLGGLFYCLVNRYDLYLADDAEVRALQNLG